MSVESAAPTPAQLGPADRVVVGDVPRNLQVLIPVAVILVLASPAVFSSSGFVDDWVDHLWLAWMQSREIRQSGLPSLFVHAGGLGVFYPNFLFYGGTLYAIAGYLMVLNREPTAVFVGLIVAAFCSAYGGTWWIARQAGVNSLVAHLPATILVSGAYYLSVAYGRGSWPELMATSAIPLLLACALSIIRRGPRPGPVLGLAIATVFWSGSHNISLVWGATFLVVIAVVAAIAFARQLTRKLLVRAGMAVGVIALGILVNGWFLLPDLRYASFTGVGLFDEIATTISDPFSRFAIVFNPFRMRAVTDPYTRSHFTELPVFVMLWAVVAAAIAWKARWRPGRRTLVTLLFVVTAVLILLLMDDGAWSLVPAPLRHIQFTFRLETYIVMALAGIVLMLLSVVQDGGVRGRRVLLGTLTAVTALGLGLGTWQVWNSDAGVYPGSRAFLTNRSRVEHYPESTPPTWYVFNIYGSFRDINTRVVPTQGLIRLDPALVHDNTITETVSIPPGVGALATNIASPAYIVSVTGLPVAGRTIDGFMALARPPSGIKSARITVREASTTAMRLSPYLPWSAWWGSSRSCWRP